MELVLKQMAKVLAANTNYATHDHRDRSITGRS